jgi:hypothetical protein
MEVLQKKIVFLKRCVFLSAAGDEAETFGHDCPFALNLQGCTPFFEWASFFMGQVDVASDKTGAGCFKALNILIDDLWPDVVWSCFDGCSAMRSTHHYAGLDGKPDGSSCHANMRRNGKPNLPNVHCLDHSLALALKFAIKLNADWSDD